MAVKKRSTTQTGKMPVPKVLNSLEVEKAIAQQQEIHFAKRPGGAKKMMNKIKKGIRSMYTTSPDGHIKSFASDMIKIVR